MGDFFLELFDRSVSAGWMILAVVLFRAAFREMPKWVRCVLWGCVAIRLVCPFSIESPVSLVPGADVLHSVIVSDSAAGRSVTGGGMTGVGNVISPVWESSAVDYALDSAVRIITWVDVAGIVWCIGVLVMLCSAAVSSIHVRHTVREAVRDRNDIYFCDTIKTPFIRGFIRPRVYLPSGLTATEMHHVLAHEEAHLKRRDQLWKPLGFLLLTVYWFQPVCWLAYILFCRDIELGRETGLFEGAGELRAAEKAGPRLPACLRGSRREGESEGDSELQKAGSMDRGYRVDGLCCHCCMLLDEPSRHESGGGHGWGGTCAREQ